MKEYWFTLSPETFLWIKCGKGLIYNSKNQQQYSFKLSNQLDKLCSNLLVTENLYTANLTETDLENHEIKEWTNSVMNIEAGFLTAMEDNIKMPVSLKPILKVQDGIDLYIWKHNNGIGGDIINYLHEITFYVNGSVYGNCEYYKQCMFPVVSPMCLNVESIASFIQNSINPFLGNINFVGNLFNYSGLQRLFDVLEKFHLSSTIYIMLQDFLPNITYLKNIIQCTNIKFNIIVAHSVDNSLLALKELAFPVAVTLIIASSEEYEILTNAMENIDAFVIPVYNGTNIDFFENNIFSEQNDLDNIALNKREIFIRQKMNISDFGKLTVMPDGVVYANVNMPPLGMIDDTLYALIYKEFTKGQSWFRIRKQFPCTECVYQWLCPSPSNYEIVIGKYNLCNIDVL
jgi:pseudo-rSAM protein